MVKSTFSWESVCSISVYSYEIPFKKPILIKGKALFCRKGLVLEASQGNSFYYAECAPLPFLSKETLIKAKEELKALFLHNVYPPFFSPSVGFSIASLFFSPPIPKKRTLCALVQGSFLEMEKALEEGFSFVKIKYHPPIEKFTSWFLEVEKQFSSMLFRIDVNQRWSSLEASYFLQRAPLDKIDYIEEPFSSLKELISFYKKTPFPLSLDETLFDTKKALPTDILKTYTIKPTLVPFFLFFRKGSIPSIFSSSYESSIGLCNIASFSKEEYALGIDTFNTFSFDLLQEPLKREKGVVLFPEIRIEYQKLCPLFSVRSFLPQKKRLENRLFLPKTAPLPMSS